MNQNLFQSVNVLCVRLARFFRDNFFQCSQGKDWLYFNVQKIPFHNQIPSTKILLPIFHYDF